MLLICSAWQNELKALPAMSDAQVETLGIGYLDAALKLERLLIQNPDINEVIFLGTCGAYDQNLEIGNLFAIESVALLGRGKIANQAYIPQDYKSYIASKLEPGLSRAQCLSSLEITSCEKFSEQVIHYYNLKIPLVENMELYGVAKICETRSISWSAILGVTNYTDTNAHQDWLANEASIVSRFSQIIFNAHKKI